MRQCLATLACLFLLACADPEPKRTFPPVVEPPPAQAPAPEPAAAPPPEPVRVPKPTLTDTCQLRSCVCVEKDVAFFVDPDVKQATWSKDGSITCPEGFELRREDQL